MRQEVAVADSGARMIRYVIGPDVAIRLAGDQAIVSGEHRLLAHVANVVTVAPIDDLF